MTRNDLNLLKRWFSEYVRSFYSTDETDQHHIVLKEKHTYNVCANIVYIAKGRALSKDNILLAEAVALFHDIGRFSQYAKFKSFNDRETLNHALYGVEILTEKNILGCLKKDEQELILQAVKFHNAFKLPQLEDEGVLLHLKLIRDADKLDILRIFLEHYEGTEEDAASIITHRLPDTPEYTKAFLNTIYNKKMISLADIKTLNDFKLLKLSWIYDFNFTESLKIVKERDYIGRMKKRLPQDDDLTEAVGYLDRFIESRL